MVENKACLLATSPLSLALLREVRAAWPLIESAAEWETSSLLMKDEKKRCDSEGIGAAAFSHHVLPLAAAAFFAFSPSSADEVANTATQKRPRRESTPLMGGFLAAGESRKSRFVLTSRVRPRGLRHNARRPWRQRRCPRRSLRPHRRGRGLRGARVARFRGRAPRERAKKCAFRRR